MAATGDIYRLKVMLEGRERAFSLNMHYLELTAPDQEIDTLALARGWDLAMRTPLLDILSASVKYVGVDVWRRHTDGSAHGQYRIPSGPEVGHIAGECLVLSSAMIIKLGQTLFSQASNGQLWIPGIPETAAVGTTVSQAHLDGPIQAFITALLVNVPEDTPGIGVWRLSVFSEAFLLLNPGDYPGATADVVEISANAVIGTNRLRSQGYRRRKVVEEEV